MTHLSGAAPPLAPPTLRLPRPRLPQRKRARLALLIAGALVAGALVGASCGGVYQYWWTFTSPCTYCWVERDVAHNYSHAAIYDKGCRDSGGTGRNCFDSVIIGTRLRRHVGGQLYGGETWGYPWAGRSYAGDTGTLHSGAASCSPCRVYDGSVQPWTMYEEW